MTTKIEWADMTINPVVGCSHCSPGCDHCYAERFAARMAKNPNPKISGKYAGVVDEHGKWTGKTNITDHMDFSKLYGMRKSKRIFVGSMTDLFHVSVSIETLRDIFSSMSLCSQHTFMLLTKRPERMADFLREYFSTPLPNVWLGDTVCNQAEADAKIPLLLQTPAAVRFVSVEPMLGPVDLGHLSWNIIDSTAEKNALTGKTWIQGNCGESSQTLQGNRLDWVICGGETGPGARPMHPDWVRGLRDQCQAAGTPFFFKSWGEWWPGEWGRLYREKTISYADGQDMVLIGKRRAGRLLDGVEHNEFPEVKA